MAKRKETANGASEDTERNAKAKRAKVDSKQDGNTPATARKGKLVEEVNGLAPKEFRARFVDEDILVYTSHRKESQEAFDLSLVAADWLTPGEHNAAFNLVEETSRADYESSNFGWHPKRKRKEMLEPEMKYIFVRRKGVECSIERKACGDVDTSILGFLSFMVDYDSSPSAPVLYIYEIHLAESLRGLGLGDHLMQMADRLAQNIGLEKVMLTCFLCNNKAHRFYVDHGFAADACSPEDRKTRNKIVAVDYVILSKPMANISGKPLRTMDANTRTWDEERSEVTLGASMSVLNATLSDGREVKVHKIIVCKANEYFRKLCGPRSHFAESKQHTIELKDDDPNALEYVLRHIYKVPDSWLPKTWRFWLDIHITADKYLEADLSRLAYAMFRKTALACTKTDDVFDTMQAISNEMDHDEGLMDLRNTLRNQHLGSLLKNQRFRNQLNDGGMEALWEQVDELTFAANLVQLRHTQCDGHMRESLKDFVENFMEDAASEEDCTLCQ